jgi:uncharacterized protein
VDLDAAPALSPDGDGTRVRVRTVPRAAASGIAGLHGDQVKVRVCAPPVDGRANAEVAAVLADALGVRVRDVTLVSGGRGRSKVLRVTGLTPPEVARRLAGTRR